METECLAADAHPDLAFQTQRGLAGPAPLLIIHMVSSKSPSLPELQAPVCGEDILAAGYGGAVRVSAPSTERRLSLTFLSFALSLGLAVWSLSSQELTKP